MLAHFELGEGFSFLVLLLPGPTGANICRQQLADYLAAKGRRLEVLSCEWREDVRRLPGALLGLQTTSDLGGVWIGSVIPESDPEIGQWQVAWRHGLAALNEHRNPLRSRFPCPLVLAAAPWLYPLLREAAPDLWSVRTDVVRVTPAASSPTEGEIESRPITLPSDLGEAADDPDYAVEQAERLRNRPELAAIRADLLLRAGNGFYRRVRHESAERCLRESAAIYRDLAACGQDFQAGLAGALNSMGVVLGVLGRSDEALANAEEAVRLYRQLAGARPDAFQPGLAGSLNNLGMMLSALGRREEALAAVEQAVRLCRQLAEARFDALLPDSAMSLNNLGMMLSALGRREEALAAAEQAVRLYRQLAEARPDAFSPDMAMSLNNLGNGLGNLGRREEALAATEEAVRLYRQLAEARPDVFLPDLAMSLNNLGNRLSALGRREEASATTEEAVRLYRQLAEAHPDAFLPELARSLGARGGVLRAMKRQTDAARSFRDGIKTLWPAFQKLPAAFATLMRALCDGYREAAKSAGHEPDQDFLAPVVALLESVSSSQEAEPPATSHL